MGGDLTIRCSWIPYEPVQREEDPSGTLLGGSSNGRTQVSGTCYLGSNPSPPTKHIRSHRLAVRTLASHARNAGSIPAGITKFEARGGLRALAMVAASGNERAELNFLLHRLLAKRQMGDVLGGVGAMLPDFWRMAHRRMRPRRLEWGSDASPAALRLLAGVRHHVESDRWFHARLGFAREEAETVAALRGAAPALNKIGMFGHPAWEMCLDGALLLRDLNAIAAILSMLFLVAYFVISLLVQLESSLGLQSYRPTLRIPGLFPALGAIGCLFAMFYYREPHGKPHRRRRCPGPVRHDPEARRHVGE